MPYRFPRSSFHGGRIIDAHSLHSLPAHDDQPNDPASVRFQSIAETLLRGIHRCVPAEREVRGNSKRTSSPDEPVLGNLGDSLPAVCLRAESWTNRRLYDSLFERRDGAGLGLDPTLACSGGRHRLLRSHRPRWNRREVLASFAALKIFKTSSRSTQF